MADSEASPPEEAKSTTEPEAPKNEEIRVEKNDQGGEITSTELHEVYKPLIVERPHPQKSRKDFYQCLGLVLIFAIVCCIGFVVLRFMVFSDKDKSKLLVEGRLTASHGVPRRQAPESQE